MSYILATGLRSIKAFLVCSEKFRMSAIRTVVQQSETLTVRLLRLLMFYRVCVLYGAGAAELCGFANRLTHQHL